MKKLTAVVLTGALALALAGCGKTSEGNTKIDRPTVQSAERQFAGPSAGDTIAIFDTSAGQFRAVLYPDLAPQACENFIGLAQGGYYNGLTFTRTESGFVIEAGQTADVQVTTLWNGKGYPVEATDQLHHYSGALCAATAEDGLGYSVFYVMQTLPGGLDQLEIWASTRRPWQYFSSSTGFSILPVGLRGTSAKMIFRGRLYRGRSVQYWLISLSVQVMPSFT